MAKYKVGCTTVEAIDTYVRITVSCFGGVDAPDIYRVSAKECPKARDVAQMLADIRGCWPDDAQLGAIGRACDDARANREMVAVVL